MKNKTIHSVKTAFATVMALLVGMTASAQDRSESKNETTMKAIELNAAEFRKQIYDYEKNPTAWKYEGDLPAVIDFYATWCGPCKMMAPVMETLAGAYEGRVRIYKVDVDKEQRLAALFGVRSIPNFPFIPPLGGPPHAVGALGITPVRRTHGEVSHDRAAVKVRTYNGRCFYGEDGQSSVGDVLQLSREEDPDIVCLQEFNARLADAAAEFALLDDTYESARFGRTQAPDSLYGAPMLILSKYRLLRSGVGLTASTSVWADLLVGDDTVRVISNHLRSTAINASDNDYITSRRFLSDTAREVKIRSIVDRFRENSVLRAEQVDSIAHLIAASPRRRIVCGDFNDTPVSYVYRTMARGLNDAFSECGSGYSHTFRGFYNTLRIDYVLSSDDFETLSYEVLPVEFSDHHPVVVRLMKRTSNN